MRHPTITCERDAQFVGDAVAGDDNAFSQLVNTYRGQLLSMMRAKLGGSDDAEDAVQEAFVSAFRHLHGISDGGKFGGWLFAIASRVAVKHLKARALDRERYRPLDEALNVAAADAGLDEEAWQTSIVREAIASLPADCRSTATLFYMARLDQHRIANVLGVPLGTIKSRLFRSRKQLRRRIETMSESQAGLPQDEDYGRAVIAGMRGVIHWQSLLEGDGFDGWRRGYEESSGAPSADWSRRGETLVGAAGSGGGAVYSGDDSWGDFELSVLITPITGGNAQIRFRISASGEEFYMLDMLMGWQAIAISKVDLRGGANVHKLSVVNYPLVHGYEYDVLIAARGASLTSYIDGKLVNQLTDFTHERGPIAFNVWESQTAFRDPRVRLLS